MSANDAVLELLKEALGRRARIVGKRMFGGVGVYLDGTFFAILDDGVLYFKTSDTSRVRYERAQSVRLEARRSTPVQVDGEVIGYLPMTFTVAPLALSVIVPRPTPSGLFIHAPETTARA